MHGPLKQDNQSDRHWTGAAVRRETVADSNLGCDRVGSTVSFSGEYEGAQEAFEAANEEAVEAAHRLVEVWRLHFGGAGPEPSVETIAGVADLQTKSQLALERVRRAAQEARSAAPEAAPPEVASLENAPHVPQRRSRRRRSETKLLRKLGSRGQRLLRAVLLLMMGGAAMAGAAAAISLALEIAGFLRLVDEPVQLPLGIQLAIFTVSCVVFVGLRRMVKAVERSLYGSKGRPAQAFPL